MDESHNIVGDAIKEYPVYYPYDKWAEQDPEDWWLQTVAAIRKLVDKYNLPKGEIRGIGFSGQMHGLVALDKDNRVLLPAILWCDNRTENECEQIVQHIGRDKLREYTGNQCLTGFTASKILWVKNNMPEIFEKIAHIMLPKDYIRYRLTGRYVTDYSDASGMLLLDVKNKVWSWPVCDFIGISAEMLPELVESYEVTGMVTGKAKELLGLTGDILVVGGAGDQAAGAIGTGTVEEGIISVALGTSGVVFAAHKDYKVDKDCRLHAFCHANGQYHTMGVSLNAASCLKWWVGNVNKDINILEVLSEAEQNGINNKVVFLPYLMGERTPYSNPDARGVFAGMDMNTTRETMTLAVLEGVAFGLRDSLEIVMDMGIPVNEIRLIGGGARSKLWKQIIANVFHMPINEVNTNQGGALGAAILAAVGCGQYPNVAAACKKIVNVVNTIEPRSESFQAYDIKYQRYRELYNDMIPWFRG